MGKVIGIDLGTTNSCVAFVEGANAGSKHDIKVLPNAEGARTTPSVVAFTQGGDRLVGQVAKRQAVTNHQNTIYAVKRLMGRKFKAPEVAKQIELAPYKILEAPNGDAWVHAQSRDYAPPEISAMVLAKMKEIAETFLGEEVTDAVVTVPAYFDDAQRQATKDAGKIAGLNVRRIINEPTAAALAYGLDRQNAERIAVYDLGGGTFDISILEIASGVFSVKATGGDTHLGGEDFDERIIDLLAREFLEEHGVDLRKDRMALQRLKESAEKAKHELSTSLETEINQPFIAATAAGPLHIERTLRRSELDLLTQDLIDRTLAACTATLQDAKLKASDIQNVILVGGMTRMPAVQKAVRDFFGREPHKGVNPDEVVAVGAAIQGAALTGQIDDVLLLDVTPLSIGVETGGGVFTRIIARNTTIPTEAREVFTTSLDNQSFVPIHVLQGERDMAADNQSLARFELTGIPPAPRGVPKIQVTFKIDPNGLLQVEAKDLATNRSQTVKVTPTSGLDQESIQRLVTEAERFRETDGLRKELAELRNQAETLLYTTEQALEGYADLVDADILTAVKKDADRLRKLVEGGADINSIREAYSTLESAAYRIAESMYGAEG
ncbi:MAG: molecular chaperone DnaK [Polyangiaceae bacterium]|jgi:molecular chaperone DnaK|nr:molecular chaperone DnaK [Polyangiaceae bacterium]